MRRWQPSDGIGGGEVLLPDSATQRAYGDACRDAIFDSAVDHVLGLGSLDQRRAFIDKYPHKLRDELKRRIKEKWQSGRSQRGAGQ